MMIPELQKVMSQDEHMQCLKEHIIQGWPENRDQILQGMRTYRMFQDGMALIKFGYLNRKAYSYWHKADRHWNNSILIIWELKKNLNY